MSSPLSVKNPRIFYTFVGLGLILVTAFIGFSLQPVGSGEGQVVVHIPRGTGFFQIVERLDKAGLITNRPFFYILAVAKGAARQIRAGEYELSFAMSPTEIIDKLVQGEIKSYMVTIPEDLTLREIADRLAAENLVDRKVFLSLLRDRAFLSSLGIKADSAEGYLFPETYRLDRSMTERDIIRIMVKQFWKELTPEMTRRAADMGLSVHQWVTLASLIGSETGYKEEKPLISAVFHNRLKRGMRLQCDPTVTYNLEHFDGVIRRVHLLKEHPYNTYRIQGLPPGPIGNPGRDSLRAALYPAAVDYLYFVAAGDGSHNFSRNLTDHRRAVAKYQIQRKKQ